ncbi:hypothetical protein ACJ73_09100 [Blastomyces percursus]|uniref:Uncharacterized protein n=1 Tax=Blastomyces percursus TaxID=1658174 RepID=A0A1J9PCJ4_9EURO|nr:hypothetical protein ACJ73_09100 [Blastomyces percursus]
MGSFDIYCALCSASLCDVEIGKKSEIQRRVRQRFIAEKIKVLEALQKRTKNLSTPDESFEEHRENTVGFEEIQGEGEEKLQSDEENSDEGEDGEVDGEDENEEEEGEENGQEDDHEYDEDNDEEDDEDDGHRSYDPDILNEESVKWLKTLHILGHNPTAQGPDKAFISGDGRYCDYVVIYTISQTKKLSDPNFPRNANHSLTGNFFSCYIYGGGDCPSNFPFHWCCFEILTRAITGSTATGNIDKDTLYRAMIGLSPPYAGRLMISYGDLIGVEQFWESVPGEEYAVTHPTIIPGFEEVLRTLILEKTFKATSPNSLNLTHKVKWDPFSTFPYDLLYSVLSFLPGDSILALMAASWPVYSLTRHPPFWKQLMYWGMPWFWELHKVIEEHPTDLDYKNLYLWLDTATVPKYGMDGPFLGIANRRRIWDACTQLAERYFSISPKPDKKTDEDFNSILQDTQIMQLPMLKYPQLDREIRTISKQLLHTLEELNSQPVTLEILWTSDGYLMGLTVSFGASCRVFGRAAATDGVTKHILPIESGDWITGFVLYLPEMYLLYDDDDAAVRGVNVIFKSGNQSIIGSHTGNCRPFIVSDNHCLVGLVGQTGEDEIISRFGILESPITESKEFSVHDAKLVLPSERPFAQRLLWGRDASQLELSNARSSVKRPIWNHPYVHVLPSSRTESVNDGVPDDLIPYQPFIWARVDLELQKLSQISAYMKTYKTSSGSMKCILGLRAAYTRRYWEPKRHVGEWPREDRMDEDPGEDIIHFEIDGPNSEYVVVVEVATRSFLKAIKFRTNKGREVCFGDQNQENWEETRPANGDIFTGLAASFRPLAEYARISKRDNRRIMSSVCALTRTITELK